MPVLQVIVVSTRPTRVGDKVARWFIEHARQHGRFEVELADLAEIALPVFNEPKSPRLGQYEHAHTRVWSARVSRADAFVIVTPEYNFSTPPSLINALTYLYREWNYKPVAFVSYGGISGGLRSVQMTRQIVTSFKMVPLVEAVTIPQVAQHIDTERDVFVPTEAHPKAATTMLDELVRWEHALRTLR